jgi:hypothetical protein
MCVCVSMRYGIRSVQWTKLITILLLATTCFLPSSRLPHDRRGIMKMYNFFIFIFVSRDLLCVYRIYSYPSKVVIVSSKTTAPLPPLPSSIIIHTYIHTYIHTHTYIGFLGIGSTTIFRWAAVDIRTEAKTIFVKLNCFIQKFTIFAHICTRLLNICV